MPELAGAIDGRLAEEFLRRQPDAAAKAVERMSADAITTLLSDLPAATVAPVLIRMDRLRAAAVLSAVDRTISGRIIDMLDAPAASVLLRLVPSVAREGIIEALSPRLAAGCREALRFPEQSAGALCDPDALTVPIDNTVEEAIAAIRTAGRAHYYLFVLDRSHCLAGVVNLRDLLRADSQAPLTRVVHTDVARLPGGAGVSAILAHPAWARVHALPVVDTDGRFLGLLSHETVKRLETERSGGMAQHGAASMVLEFGELVWSAGAAVVGEMGDAISTPPGASRDNQS